MRLIFRLFLVLGLLASCTQNEEVVGTGEIRLGVRSDVYSRGSVGDFTALIAVGDQIGVYGVNTNKTKATDLLEEAWATATYTMDNVCTDSISKKSGEMKFAKGYTYPDNMQVKFLAYYPYAKTGVATDGRNYLEAATQDQAPLLHFTINGALDLMYATPVIGSQTDAADKVLEFNHALTQLSFILKDPVGIVKDTKVKMIKINKVNTSSTMNIETGAFGEWGTPIDSELKVDPSVAVTASGVVINGAVMLQPGLTGFNLSIVTENNITYSGITIKPDKDLVFEAGTAYEITLTFLDKKEIKSSVAIQPWVMGGYSDNIVQ